MESNKFNIFITKAISSLSRPSFNDYIDASLELTQSDKLQLNANLRKYLNCFIDGGSKSSITAGFWILIKQCKEGRINLAQKKKM